MKKTLITALFVLLASIVQANAKLDLRLSDVLAGDSLRIQIFGLDNEQEHVFTLSLNQGTEGQIVPLNTKCKSIVLRILRNGEMVKNNGVRYFVSPKYTYSLTGSANKLMAITIESNDPATPLINAGLAIECRYDDVIAAYMTARKQKDSTGIHKAEKEFKENSDAKLTLQRTILDSLPTQPIALHALSALCSRIEADAKDPILPTMAEVEERFASLPQSLKDSPNGQWLSEEIMQIKKSGIGALAPEFTLTATTGEKISVSDYRGRWLILDFWASWCGPCRQSNPNMVKLYNTYHQKGLEIVGLGTWDKVNAWKQAIQEDGLPWTHVTTDEQVAKQDPVHKTYGIKGVPTALLINPEGVIVFRGHPNALESQIQKFFVSTDGKQ